MYMVNFIIEISVVNLQINEQYINCEITKDFIKMRRLFKVIYLEKQDRT